MMHAMYAGLLAGVDLSDFVQCVCVYGDHRSSTQINFHFVSLPFVLAEFGRLRIRPTILSSAPNITAFSID